MLEELFGVSFNLVKESNSEQQEYEQEDYEDDCEEDYDDDYDDDYEDLKDIQDSILDNNKTQHIQESVVYNEGVNVQSVTNQNARTTVTTSKGGQKSLSNATLLARSENNQIKP